MLNKSGGSYALGAKFSYIDLSLFQLVEGMRYAFPGAMKRIERKVPRVVAVCDRVAARPRIKAYLGSNGAFRSTSGASSGITDWTATCRPRESGYQGVAST